MKYIFISSTIHSDWNVQFNPRLCEALEKKELSCYLPQRNTDQVGTKRVKFEQNVKGIADAKVVIVVIENETPNLGAEVGFAYGIGKPLVFLARKGHEPPLMFQGMASTALSAHNLDAIDDYIDELVKLIKEIAETDSTPGTSPG